MVCEMDFPLWICSAECLVEFREVIRPTIPNIVRGLKGSVSRSYVRKEAIEGLSELAKYCMQRVPLFVDMFNFGSTEFLGEFRETIRPAIPTVVGCLRGSVSRFYGSKEAI